MEINIVFHDFVMAIYIKWLEWIELILISCHDFFSVFNYKTTLVRYTTDENESRVLYEFLADASMVFPRVFPVM